RTVVGILYPSIFGLSSVVSSVQVGEAIQPSANTCGFNYLTLGAVLVIRGLAMGRQLHIAKLTSAAGNGEGHHYAVAFFQLCNTGTYYFNYAHELMPQYHIFQLRNHSVVNMQVRPANGC